MKQLFLLIFLSFALCFSQPLNERQTINKTHIDFITQYIYFVIHGLIEIDGHTFYNDTCKSPIIFQATLDGVTVIDTLTKQTYTHRKCDKVGCSVIHLSKTVNQITIPKNWQWYNGNTLELNSHSVLTPCIK
jgi:hypothetical protein